MNNRFKLSINFLKKKWPYILGLSIVTAIMSSIICGLDLVLTHPDDYPFLEESCNIANCDMQYKDVVVLLLMCIIACVIINLFVSLCSFFLNKITEVKKDE